MGCHFMSPNFDIVYTTNGSQELSYCQLCCHWWHWRLSELQWYQLSCHWWNWRLSELQWCQLFCHWWNWSLYHNLQCHQWQKSWHYDNSWLSVTLVMAVLYSIPYLICCHRNRTHLYKSSVMSFVLCENLHQISIGSGDGLAPNCHQANTWGNDDHVSELFGALPNWGVSARKT